MAINVDVSAKIQEKMCAKEGYIWNLPKCACENDKYLGGIIDNSVICDDRNNKKYSDKTCSSKNYSNKF